MKNNRDFFRKHFGEGEFGLEQESLRVDADGRLAQTPHPFPDNRQIERDFCENQVELITEVCPTVDDLTAALKRLRAEVQQTLLNLKTGPEYLWPFSSPPAVLNEAEIPVARYAPALAHKEAYREYLAGKYGKWKMLFSGIHFNFSFPDELILELFRESGSDNCQEFRNQLYLDLGRGLVNYCWLIVYLTAASPVLDPGFAGCPEADRDRYASPRCSEIGYWNLFEPSIDFTSVDSYVDSIERYIKSGQLAAGSELYYPVRLKPRGENTPELLRNSGINHLELRVLDLNPLVPEGICREDLYFIYLLLIYLAADNGGAFHRGEDHTHAIGNMKRAALYDDSAVLIRFGRDGRMNIREAALRVLDDLEAFLGDWDEAASSCIAFQRQKILNRPFRYAVVIRDLYQNNYVQKGMELQRSRSAVR